MVKIQSEKKFSPNFFSAYKYTGKIKNTIPLALFLYYT